MSLIIKVINLKKVTNRLVGFFKATENDFDPVKQGSRMVNRPNEYFYKKFNKAQEREWSNDYGYRILSDTEIAELVASFKRKQKFYEKQANHLETLTNL